MIKAKEVFKLAWMPVLFSSLCCVTPLILVVLGLSTVSFAASLSDTLYGDYKWVFRGIGLLLLSLTTLSFFRNKKGICTLDQVKRRKNEIINIILVISISGVIAYVVWLYVIVEFFGKIYKIW